MSKIRVGFALTGSFCTFSKVVPEIEKLVSLGYEVIPIMSETSYSTDTRFGTAQSFIEKIEDICDNKILHTQTDVEPIGPKNLLDILIIAPCTGNTIGKIANGCFDTSVTLACKAHLRNNKPVILAVSTNDALGLSAKNIGILLNCKNMYFVPMGQDSPMKKTNSVVAHFSKIADTVEQALEGRQIQPMLAEHK